MRLRLIRKLADRLDGIDLSKHHSGDLIDMPSAQAQLIVAEHWAAYARRDEDLHPDAAHHSNRRRNSGDLHDRLESKREAIERDRRQMHRRATDVAA